MASSLLAEFRTIDGTGNNLDNPSFNAAGSAELRIAPANFAADTANGLIDAPNARSVTVCYNAGGAIGRADIV